MSRTYLERLVGRAMIAVVLFAASVADAFAWEGRVILARSGAPVAGAEVSVLGSNVVQTTDKDGRFELGPTRTPPFEILVVLPGGRYMKPILVRQLSEGRPLTLEVEPMAEETVTVSGAAPAIEAAPASGTTLVPRADIELRQPGNLAQALENVAGVAQASEGHAAVPVVRGLARGRTVVLVDGSRVTSERRAGPSATFLDPFVLDTVEVARGPGSVAYGSDAVGGVVSARTRSFEPGGPLSVRASGAVSSGETGSRVGVELSRGLGEHGGFLVAGHHRSYDDWKSPAGEVFNSGWRDAGLLLRAGGRVGPGMLTGSFHGDYGRDIERPRNNSQTVRFFYPEENSNRFSADYDVGPTGGFSRMGVTAFVGSYSQITDQDRFQDVPRTVERADVTAKDFQLRGFAERMFGDVRFEVGVDVNGRYDLHALDVSVEYQNGVPVETVNVSVDDARRTDAGAYAWVEAQLSPRLSGAFAARGDSVRTTNSGGFFGDRSTSNSGFSGLAALTAGSFGGFSATAQVARGFRDPVLSDRYFRGPSGRGFITGNPDLEPESSLQYDLAFHYTMERGRVALYGYQYKLTDLIERYEEADDFFFFRNRGGARLQGVELEAQARLGVSFSLSLAAQVERGVTLDDGIPIDDIPARSISLQGKHEFPRGFVTLRVAGVARDEAPGPSEIEAPGYCLVDVGGGWTVAKWLDLTVYVRNVLDQKYYASPDPRFVLAPGIAATLTASLKF